MAGGASFGLKDYDSITKDERLKPVLSNPNLTIIRNDLIFDAVLVLERTLRRYSHLFVLEVRRTFRVVEIATNPDLQEVFKALKRGMTDTGLFDSFLHCSPQFLLPLASLRVRELSGWISLISSSWYGHLQDRVKSVGLSDVG